MPLENVKKIMKLKMLLLATRK